jgi:glutathione peroxidase
VATIYDFDVTAIDGSTDSMDRFRGQTLLVVNVASECGMTPQYAGLEALYRKYKSRGFVVLGFPCNQFGGQEPGSNAEIDAFCTEKYDISFPLFSKINVNGDDAHPLFEFLKTRQRGLLGTAAIKWNFTKFLVDRNGEVVARFGPSDPPERIAPVIERLTNPDVRQ